MSKRLKSISDFLKSKNKALARIAIGFVIFVGLSSGYIIYTLYQYYYGTPEIPYLRADLSDLTDDTLSHYYVNGNGKWGRSVDEGMIAAPPFDENGIVQIDYKREIGRQYNPCYLSLYALEYWELYLDSNQKKYKDVFLRQSDWLVEEQEDDGKWYFHFPWKPREKQFPWISAMAQGLGISVLLRAWQVTDDPKYLRAAEKSLEIFKIPVDRGGIADKKGPETWFQEYPGASDCVLNGHIWALFGLWDMWRVKNDPEALQLFNQGVTALRANLHKYDTGFWIMNNLTEPDVNIPATPALLLGSHYFDFQINQLIVMYAVTGGPIFSEYAKKWEQYRKNKLNFIRILRWRIPVQAKLEARLLREKIFGGGNY